MTVPDVTPSHSRSIWPLSNAHRRDAMRELLGMLATDSDQDLPPLVVLDGPGDGDIFVDLLHHANRPGAEVRPRTLKRPNLFHLGLLAMAAPHLTDGPEHTPRAQTPLHTHAAPHKRRSTHTPGTHTPRTHTPRAQTPLHTHAAPHTRRSTHTPRTHTPRTHTPRAHTPRAQTPLQPHAAPHTRRSTHTPTTGGLPTPPTRAPAGILPIW